MSSAIALLRLVSRRHLIFLMLLIGLVFGTAAAANAAPDTVAHFDPASGQWHIRSETGSVQSFYYGIPGDTPLVGDWDCDGTDTVGMYRRSNGFVYLRNSNDFGVADLEFFFGEDGDLPLVGDWNGDDCDTLGVYRNGEIFIANTLGTVVGEFSFFFGVPGDTPFTADFDGDGLTSVGVYRDTTGFMYFRNTLDTGAADFESFYGVPSDRIVAGDWDDDGDQTVGVFRPSENTFYLTNDNARPIADVLVPFGQPSWLPAAGQFGTAQTGVLITDPPANNIPVLATFDPILQDFAAEVTFRARVSVPPGQPYRLVWTSDVSGVLGAGEEIDAKLIAGQRDVRQHIVTATLTTDGQTFTDQVEVI
ncbi:MAG: hypothetical protein HKO03_11480, partial [Acidimicrobiia bacterium]|nr:hypothetical protein [Acidimicrobiia bacterium]